MPTGSPIDRFDDLAAGQRIGVVQGTVEEAYVVDTLHLQPVKFPDFTTVYANLKTHQIDAWVAPAMLAPNLIGPATRRPSSPTHSARVTSWPTRSPRTTGRCSTR